MSERTVTIRLRALISDYQKAMQTAAGDSKKFASVVKGNFTQLNNDVGKLGETMTRRVTLPLVGVGVGAVKLASDFETTFGQMVGLAGVAAGEVDGLREAVLKLSKDTARGPNELAQALYFIRSSGIDAAHAMGVLEVAAKASAAGLGSTVNIADAVVSAMNAYGAANLSAVQATDILVAAIGEGTFEASQLAPVLGMLTPTAAAMGISFAEVNGVLSVMSRTMGKDGAAEAATSLNAIFSTLLGTSKEGVDALAEHGLSLKALRDVAAGPGGLVEVMRILDRTFAGNDEALSQVVPNIRAFRGVMNLLAQDGASVDRVMHNVANSTGATDDAFKAVKTKWAFELKQAVVVLQIALVRLGEVAGPMLATLGHSAAVAAEAFSQLPQWVQQVVVSLGLVAIAAGPAMKIFSVLAGPAVSAIKLIIGQLVALRTTIIANQVAGMSYGRALGQVATGMATTVTAALPLSLLLAGVALTLADNAAKAREAAAGQRELAQAIKDTGSVGGGLVAKLTEAAAANQDFAAAIAGAGATVGDVAAALEAGGPQWDAMHQRLLDGGKAAGNSSIEMIRLGEALNALPAQLEGAIQHQKNLDKATGAVTAGAMRGGLAYSTFGSAIDDASKEAENFERAMSGIDAVLANAEDGLAALAAEAQIADNAMRRLLSALDAMYGTTFAVSDAQQAYADSLIEVDTAAKASGGSSRNLEKDQRALAKATDDVTKAQKDLADAEAALAEARKGPSAREKSDAGLNVREAQLGVKEAIKAQADARKRLLEERKKGKDGDVAGAQLDLERASISLKRAQDRLTDAQAEQNKVMHSGEETSEKVKSALDDVTSAQERVTDATEAQSDAEAQLRGEAGGGPVADRGRNIARSYDNMVQSAKDWITKLIEQKAPTADIIAALDTQTTSAKNLIAAYGDPDGKLQKFIDNNERLRLIFTDDKFMTNFNRAAQIIGGFYGVVIPDFLGSDATGPAPGRAKGGPTMAGRTYMVGENGPELWSETTNGNMTANDKLGKVSSLYSSPMMSASSMGLAPSIELTVNNIVESNIVRIANELVTLSKHGALPINVKQTH